MKFLLWLLSVDALEHADNDSIKECLIGSVIVASIISILYVIFS